MTAARRSLQALRAAVVSLLLLGQLLADARAESRPQIQLPEKTFSFGSVPAGHKVIHEFPVRNAGSADLQIIGANPSCGCTIVSLPPAVIKPGETALMKVEFDTSGFSGDKTKTVELASNDASNPRVVVALKGTVLAGAVVEPAVLEFGRLSQHALASRPEKRFTVRVPENVPGDISQASCGSPHMELREIARSAKEATYALALKHDMPFGLFRDRVLVQFSGGKIEPLNVPVVGTADSDIVVKPSTISFGVVAGERELERRVLFEYHSKDPLTIKQVTSSDSAVSAYYQPGGGRGMDGVIVVKLNPKKVRGDLKATVEIATSHPTQPKTFLNVYATLPPA